MHRLRKLVKGERVLLFFGQTPHRFPDRAAHTWL
jgi:hypothetical protein